MKKLLISTVIAVLLLIILASIAYAATGVTNPVVLKELAQVRQATAKYHDVNVAIADGYVPTGGGQIQMLTLRSEKKLTSRKDGSKWQPRLQFLKLGNCTMKMPIARSLRVRQSHVVKPRAYDLRLFW